MQNSCKRQQGLTLIELSISIGVSALLVILFLEARVKDVQELEIKAEAVWVIEVMKDIREGLSNDANFSRVNDSLLNVNSVPAAFFSMVGGAVAVSNGQGGQVHVAGRTLTLPDNALGLTYTHVSKDVCASLIAAFEGVALQKGMPLFGIIGSPSILSNVPTWNWNASTKSLEVTGSDVALKSSPGKQLDVAATAKFCRSQISQKSITLIRAWSQ
jgi:hypothetical protein